MQTPAALGYTYALQLVAHDMVDTSLPFWAMSQGAETRNLQTRPLRLNTVYGAGPGLFPLAYSADPTSGESIAFRLGTVRARPTGADPVPAGRDIPRVSLATTMDSATATGLNAALLADERNDQHLLLSQMTVIFMLLHNAILAKLPPVPDNDMGAAEHALVAETRFACAKAATVLIYRDVLRNDILRHILHPKVLSLYDAGVPLLERDSSERGVPLEFSHGAFRFGHAMVRSDYQFGSADDVAARHPIEQILRLNSGGSVSAFPSIRAGWWTGRTSCRSSPVTQQTWRVQLVPPRSGDLPRTTASARSIPMLVTRELPYATS
jgi:hypothetical protein